MESSDSPMSSSASNFALSKVASVSLVVRLACSARKAARLWMVTGTDRRNSRRRMVSTRAIARATVAFSSDSLMPSVVFTAMDSLAQ